MYVICCTISNTNNEKEFIAKLVVDLMKQNNPNCFIVTGQPRTPRDQGSIESTNKFVQCVMKSISLERCLAGLEVNWTRFLGQVMAVCNSLSGRKKIAYPTTRLYLDKSIIPCYSAAWQKCVNAGLFLRGFG
jgi:hypothetical protein